MSSFLTQRIFIAGHRGMVGSALVRHLRARGAEQLLLRTRDELDLTRQDEVEHFFREYAPDLVLFAAARVGGIHANATYPADFIRDNLLMASHTIDAAHRFGTRRLVFLGSTCIYPRLAPQPIPEDALLTGPLEPTNEAYALAKIAGLKMCQHYRRQFGVLFHSAMPTNLYGPGDNYHPENSHVLPGLLARFHAAKEQQAEEVQVWGSGRPLREFLHVDDLADGVLFLCGLEDPPDWVNIGSGRETSIADLARQVAATVGYEGRITFDTAKPDGTPRKLTDTARLQQLGWHARIELTDGLRTTYQDFLHAPAGVLRK